MSCLPGCMPALKGFVLLKPSVDPRHVHDQALRPGGDRQRLMVSGVEVALRFDQFDVVLGVVGQFGQKRVNGLLFVLHFDHCDGSSLETPQEPTEDDP